MPSTYSPLLRTELLATGEQAGTWGTAVNTIHGTILEAAIAGTATVVLPAGTADYSLTALNGIVDEARFAVLKITATITANRNVICPSLSKQYLVYNATSGAFTVTLKTLAGTGVVLPQGAYTLVHCDGTNVVRIAAFETSPTGSAIIPARTTVQRDADTPAVGYFGYNRTTNSFDGYGAAGWAGIGGGTSGGGTDKAFYENDATITAPYTIGQAGLLPGATVTIATPGVVTLTGHGFIADSQVFFETTGALPTGLLVDTGYWVIATGLTTNAFQLSLTQGGAAINTTVTQSGTHSCGKLKNATSAGAITIATGVTITIPSGATWSIG